ncbi:MAG TPA: cytochrome c oxidase assembly protein [Woeseiaceae bacterium]|nr:cytochrome c oxidase assembly protein [Woeseiaceae bacterium]
MVQAFGHLSAQMLLHIVLMNAVAPLLALAFRGTAARGPVRLLLPATLSQIVLLWAWHAPPALAAVMRSGVLHAGMQASLFLAALWFWFTIIVARDARWQAILALLVTGKLFCLMGVLLAFAPRGLYPGLATGSPQAALADQQLAGLLMLLACPATYVAAGIVIAARWLARLEHDAARQRTPHARYPA